MMKNGDMKMTDMTLETMRARIAELEAANTALKAKETALKLKVSPKGGVSLYGMGRFPTTLYKDQWLRVLDHADAIREFIRVNDTSLTVK